MRAELYEAVSILAAASTTVWVWWKDNDIRKTTRLAKLQVEALQEEELRKLEAERGRSGSGCGSWCRRSCGLELGGDRYGTDQQIPGEGHEHHSEL